MNYRMLPKLEHCSGATLNACICDALSYVCRLTEILITEIEAVTQEGYVQAKISGDNRIFAYKDCQGDVIVEITKLKTILIFALSKKDNWSIKSMHTALIVRTNSKAADVEIPDVHSIQMQKLNA